MTIPYDNGLSTLFGLSQLPQNSYEFGGQAFTTQELWIKIAEKINIIIEHFNYLDKNFTNEKENTKEKFEYLLGEGLSEQVARIILVKIADGTLGQLINETLLKDINNKVDVTKTELNNKIDNTKEEIDSQLSDIVINVDNFGAVGDGLVDDAPAIRKAISSLQNKKGELHFTKGKTYLIDSLTGTSLINGDYAFVLESDICINGNNATLKFGNNMVDKAVNIHGGSLFYAIDKENITIKNLKVDMNGLNNLTPLGKVLGGYTFKCVRCKNIILDNNKIENSFGLNVFVVSGDNARITNNYIKNGGTSILNANQTDFSAIYAECSNSVIENNIIKHDREPLTFCGGIELHASNIVCRNNYIEKSIPGIYICSDGDRNSLTENITVEDNKLIMCHSGIHLFGSGKYKNLTINNNYITLKSNPNATSTMFSFGIFQPFSASENYNNPNSCLVDNGYITNNIIKSIEELSQNRGMMLSALRNVIISNNQLQDITCSGIRLSGSEDGITNTSITDNKFLNCGKNNISSDNNALFIAILGSSPTKNYYEVKNLEVKRNLFIGNKNSSSTYYVNAKQPECFINVFDSENIILDYTNIKSGAYSNIFSNIANKTSVLNNNGYKINEDGTIDIWIESEPTITPDTPITIDFPIQLKQKILCVSLTQIGSGSPYITERALSYIKIASTQANRKIYCRITGI